MAEILHQFIGSFPIIYRVSYIPGGAGFQPSTGVWPSSPSKLPFDSCILALKTPIWLLCSSSSCAVGSDAQRHKKIQHVARLSIFPLIAIALSGESQYLLKSIQLYCEWAFHLENDQTSSKKQDFQTPSKLGRWVYPPTGSNQKMRMSWGKVSDGYKFKTKSILVSWHPGWLKWHASYVFGWFHDPYQPRVIE